MDYSLIRCIGVIIDGNRRWARSKNLSPQEGHRAGYEKMKEFLPWCKEAGISHLIVYALSTENLSRAPQEVAYLLGLIARIIKDDLPELKKQGVRLSVMGSLERIPRAIRMLLAAGEQETKRCKKLHLGLCIAYGGRDEIISAINRLMRDRRQFSQEITQEIFSRYLWTRDIPDPDLIIRTSGEMRLSNFLPWQSSYSELFFPSIYWPDIQKQDFLDILEEYQTRHRRFGK